MISPRNLKFNTKKELLVKFTNNSKRWNSNYKISSKRNVIIASPPCFQMMLIWLVSPPYTATTMILKSRNPTTSLEPMINPKTNPTEIIKL